MHQLWEYIIFRLMGWPGLLGLIGLVITALGTQSFAAQYWLIGTGFWIAAIVMARLKF